MKSKKILLSILLIPTLSHTNWWSTCQQSLAYINDLPAKKDKTLTHRMVEILAIAVTIKTVSVVSDAVIKNFIINKASDAKLSRLVRQQKERREEIKHYEKRIKRLEEKNVTSGLSQEDEQRLKKFIDKRNRIELAYDQSTHYYEKPHVYTDDGAVYTATKKIMRTFKKGIGL